MANKDKGVVSSVVEKKTFNYAVGSFSFNVTLDVSTRNEIDSMLQILAKCKEDCEKLLEEKFAPKKK